jgi:hypothetical protein
LGIVNPGASQDQSVPHLTESRDRLQINRWHLVESLVIFASGWQV